MKASIISSAAAVVLSVLSGVSALPAADTEHVSSVGGTLAPPDGEVHCETSDRSPGIANIAVASVELANKGGQCELTGSKVQMVHRDGIRVYLLGDRGSASCVHVADMLEKLIEKCTSMVAGDTRAGGTVYVNNIGTYLQVSQ